MALFDFAKPRGRDETKLNRFEFEWHEAAYQVSQFHASPQDQPLAHFMLLRYNSGCRKAKNENFQDRTPGSREDMLMKVRTFTAIIHREGDLYVATCPELGTVSQGTTIENALANLKEATELYLEEFPLPDVGRPLLTTFETTYA